MPQQCSRIKPSSWPDAPLLFSKSFPSMDLSFLLCKMVVAVAVVSKEDSDSLIRGFHLLQQCQVRATEGRRLISHKTNHGWL